MTGPLCEVAQVSRSGYYRWLKTADKPDRDHDDYLAIKGIFDQGRGKYGWRSIKMRLPQGAMNHKKIIRIMRKYHLAAKVRRANPYRQMAKKTLEHRTFKNLLNREFEQAVPFRVFCTDITYLPFNYRMAYLSVIKDIASGEIVAWMLSIHPELDLALGTVEKLKSHVALPPGSLDDAMIHSDQGVQYSNPAFSAVVKNLKMVQSMSRKGNCIDNAPVESFFGHLKDEVDYRGCKTFSELESKIAEYMEYYNNGRYQWNLKKMTPVEYRNHLLRA